MASEKAKKTAKLIASAVRGRSVFVLAAKSEDPVLAGDNVYKSLNKAAKTAFACSDCGTHMHVVASSAPKPYCITCGSMEVNESDEEIPETTRLVSDEEVAKVVCSTCSTANILNSNAITASGGALHCVSCGDNLEIVESAEGFEVPEVGDEIRMEVPSELEDPIVTEEVRSSDETDDTDFPSISGTDGLEEGNVNIEENEIDALEVADTDDQDHEVEVEVEDSTEEASEGLYLDSNDSGEPVADALSLDDTEDGLSIDTVVSAGSSLLVARKGVHAVAYITAKMAGDNADLIGTKAFATAVKVTASKHGMRKALAHMKFAPILAKAMDKLTLSKGVVQAKASFAADQSKKDKAFADSLAIAAAGMARGTFKATPNPIKEALVSEFAALGVRNSKSLASRIMMSSGMEYAKTLVQTANKLAAMSPNMRKEYADMLDLVEDASNADETMDMVDRDHEEVSDDIEHVTSRMNTAALLTRPAGKQLTQTSSVAAILAGTQPIKFSTLY